MQNIDEIIDKIKENIKYGHFFDRLISDAKHMLRTTRELMKKYRIEDYTKYKKQIKDFEAMTW